MQKKERAPNYSEAQEKVLLESAPFDHAKAKELAESMGKNAASIVAKIKRMENDKTINPTGKEFYKAKEAYVPKTGKPVEKKSEILSSVEVLLGVNPDFLKGLDKSPKSSLEKLRESIKAKLKESELTPEMQEHLEAEESLMATEAQEVAEG